MRTMQEDQFKMLQLVVESSQQKGQTAQHTPASYMMYPQMYPHMYQYPPQFFGQGGYAGYAQMTPQMYGQYYPGWGRPDDLEGSCTETDMSEAEQIQEGRRPTQSELSKAEQTQYAQAYQQQQEQMREMQKRMSEMQRSYQQQIDDMRKSHEEFKKARSERSQSRGSEKKVLSYKDFREDDQSDVNKRDPDFEAFQSKFDNKTISHRNSQIAVKTPVMVDQSAQVMDSIKQGHSILKRDSTIRTDFRTASPKKEREPSQISIAGSMDLSRHPMPIDESYQSRRQSIAASKSEKSFRVPPEMMRISRHDAALRIQKNFRAYRDRQDYQMIMRRGSQKKFLFKATVRGQQAQIIQCSVNMSTQGRPIGLLFVLSEARRPQRSQKAEIDLQRFEIRDTTDLKDKVLRIIKQALGEQYIIQAIRQAFSTQLAREILEAEFFSSDEQFGNSDIRYSGLDSGLAGHDSALGGIPEEQDMNRMPFQGEPNMGSVIPGQRSLIDAEIERIRKRCDIQYTVNVENVVVKGHKRKIDDYEYEDQVDAELEKHVKLDSDDEHREINIQRIGIRRRAADQAGQDEEYDEADDSQHDYEIVLGKGAQGKT